MAFVDLDAKGGDLGRGVGSQAKCACCMCWVAGALNE